MVGTCFKIGFYKQKKREVFICLLREIIECIMQEEKKINAGEFSSWNLEQLKYVVLPEMSELLAYALQGEILFPYGKKCRLLKSTYLMTDSLEK